jgi:hypothetical protein
MRRLLAATTVLLVLCGAAAAQDPAKPTIDQLAADVLGIRAKRAELDKAEAEKLTAIAAELKRQRELLEKLGPDGPAPKPPAPVPPKPDDPLKTKLKSAYDADPAAPDARRASALDLAALYRAAADLARDETVGTSGELLAKVGAAAVSLLKDPPGARKLAAVRRVASGELAALLPTDAPLTADQRAATAALFLKLASALEETAK